MRRRQKVVWCVTVFGWVSLAACDNSTSRQPTLPSAARPSPSATRPPLDARRLRPLSGVVFEDASPSSRPVPGGRVFFSVDSRPGGHVGVDTSGELHHPRAARWTSRSGHLVSFYGA